MTTAAKLPTQETAVEVNDTFSNVLLFSGIALAIFGMIGIVASVLFTLGTVVLFGVLLIASGFFEFVHAFRAKGIKNVLWNVLSGILYGATGIILLIRPLAGALGLTLVISAFLFFAGVIRIAYGFQHRTDSQRGWYVAAGLVDIVLGLMIAIGWPFTGLWVIGMFVGIEMLVNGTSAIALSLALRQTGLAEGKA